MSTLLALVTLPALAQHHNGGHGRGPGHSAGGFTGRVQPPAHITQAPAHGGYRGAAPVPFFQHSAPRPQFQHSAPRPQIQHSAPRPHIQHAPRPVQLAPPIPAPRIQVAPPATYYRAPERIQSYGHNPGYGSSQRNNHEHAFGTAFGAPYGTTYGTTYGSGYAQPRGHSYGTAPSYVQPYFNHAPRPVVPRWSFPNGYHLNRAYPALGYRLPSLGPGHLALGFGGARWFFDRGVWYRPAPAGYVVAVPPYGLLTPSLPPSFASINYGGVPYYYDNGVYYTEVPGQGYLVTPPPTGLPPIAANAEGSTLAQANPLPQTELQVSPLSNQSSAQYYSDRADCSRWANEQSGYDPARNIPTDDQNLQRAQTYRDAETNCLRSRSYEVR